MSNPRVAIELYVDDKGTLRIKQFAADSDDAFKRVEQSGTGAASRIREGWDKLKGAWVEILGGIAAVREAWDLMNSAAKAEQEKRSFESLAASYGASGSQIISSLKEISRGTVDTMTLIRSAGTAMMMGIKPDDTIQLMKIAAATAKMTGQTTVQAFADISLAVGRQSRMILDNLGIIIDEEKAYDGYKAKLNIVGRELTETEKKQAFMNATLTAGKDLMARMGDQATTQADKFQRFTATMENLKVAVGSGLIRVFYAAKGVFEEVAASALIIAGGILKIIETSGALTDALHMTKGAAASWKIETQAAFGAADELANKAAQSFKDAVTSNNDIIKGQKAYTKEIQATTAAQKELEEARKEIIAQHKKEAEEIAAAQEEMYKETGQMAEAHYAAEAQKLVEKAARWQKAGGDIVTTENWLYDQIGVLEEEAAARGEVAASGAMDRMQSNYRGLVDELQSVTQFGVEQMDALGMKIQGLDGTKFTIHAALNGSGFESTIDTLIGKMRLLAALSSGSNSGGTPSGGGSSATTDTDAAASQSGKALMLPAGKSISNTTINIHQKWSRSDVTAILSEQKRQEVRK